MKKIEWKKSKASEKWISGRGASRWEKNFLSIDICVRFKVRRIEVCVYVRI